MLFVRSIRDFHQSFTIGKLALLFIVAFLLRAATFYYYVQHNERYKQPDSSDYHICTIGLYIGAGMCRLDNKWPTFWRTPGYPAYLLPFYKWYGVTKPHFEHNAGPQKAAIWMQIFLSSFTPLIIFFLALVLVNSISLSWVLAWLFAFHPGFILASCFLLTEALSMLFFFLFLLCLYRGYRLWSNERGRQTYLELVFAALSLGIYTWLRPMGQFVALITLLILVLGSVPFTKKLKQMLVFAFVFLGVLSPWINRNYHYTGHYFFWPGSGSYLVCFNVPKIKRHLSGRTLKECFHESMREVRQELIKEYQRIQKEEPGHFVSQELVGLKVAWPWISQHPFLLAYDWAKEVLKTTFDLYGYQLAAFAAGTWKADPLEEFLTEKTAACLYAQPMHWFMRFLCWLELLFSLLLWFGLLMGFVNFLVKSVWYTFHVSEYQKRMFFLWVPLGLMIGAVLCMTGGFGYARLRMPVEPLMALLSATWWYYYVFVVASQKSEVTSGYGAAVSNATPVFAKDNER